MEYPLAEILDRMTIQKLKIERIGEPHLKKEFVLYEKAIEDIKNKGIKIDDNWFLKLYEINGRIWDNEFIIRNMVNNKKLVLGDKELIEIGKRYIKVGDLMKERDNLKNKIVEITGLGFKIIKKDHSAE